MKIGIIGTGRNAFFHAEVIRELGAEVVVGSARSMHSEGWKKMKGLFPQMEFVAEGKEIFSRSFLEGALDGILVTLPWDLMEDWLPSILNSPKPVLIEKPIALTSHKILSACKEFPHYLSNKVVAFNRRFYEPVLALRRRVQEGGLVSVYITISEEVEHQVERHGLKIVPHLLHFSSAHTLDLIFFLFGKVSIVDVRTHSKKIGEEVFLSFNGLLENESRIPLLLSLNACDPSLSGITCRFSDGTLWQLSPLETLSIFDKNEVTFNSSSRMRQYLPRCSKTVQASSIYKAGYLEQMRGFFKADYQQCARVEDALHLAQWIENLQSNGKL